jgi:hypothetical protein
VKIILTDETEPPMAAGSAASHGELWDRLRAGDQSALGELFDPPVASGSQVPDAIKVDRGPATAAEVKAAMGRRTPPGVKRMEPLWSRKVAEVIPGQSATGVIVLAKNTPAPPGDGVALGLGVCYTRTRSGGVDDHAWAEHPTEAQGITKLAGGFMNAGYNGPGKPRVVEFNDRE